MTGFTFRPRAEKIDAAEKLIAWIAANEVTITSLLRRHYSIGVSDAFAAVAFAARDSNCDIHVMANEHFPLKEEDSRDE